MVNPDRLPSCGEPPATTMADRLRFWAERRPQETAFVFWSGEDDSEETRLSYSALDRQARSVAVELAARGLSGQRALLLYPAGLEFVAAVFGCLYAGVTAVPVVRPGRNRNLDRVQRIAADARAAIVLTPGRVLDGEAPRESAPQLPRLPWLATDELDEQAVSHWSPPAVDASLPAVLQYTSGSTGAPRGVMISHANLMHNGALIARAFEPCPGTAMGFIWLPNYHDMGLVGGILQPVFSGFPAVLMPPLAFLQNPVRWLRGVTRYGATISGGPNFAYALCHEKISAEDCAGLDLSRWEVAFNGAEPVRAETLEAFSRKFEPYGFRPEAFYPCYGLAEATLLVSVGDKRRPPVIRGFDAAALERNCVVRMEQDQGHIRRLVGCGAAPASEAVLIVDPQTHRRLPEGNVGEIWVAGASVGQGYWIQPEASEETFRACFDNGGGPFLRTGDLGFMDDGELFVAGRRKEVMILRGRILLRQSV
jgi:acyl-CoA synthetase (AMP-forming)/AMP-acid ligase II